MNNNISSSRPAFGARLIIPPNTRNLKYCKDYKFLKRVALSKSDVAVALKQAQDILKSEAKGKPGDIYFCGFSKTMDKLFFLIKQGINEKISAIGKESFKANPKEILKEYDGFLKENNLKFKAIQSQNKRNRQFYNGSAKV